MQNYFYHLSAVAKLSCWLLCSILGLRNAVVAFHVPAIVPSLLRNADDLLPSECYNPSSSPHRRDRRLALPCLMKAHPPHFSLENEDTPVFSHWKQLRDLAQDFKQQSGRIMFTYGELEKLDAALATEIQQSVKFTVAKTPQELIEIYLEQPSIQLVLSFITAVTLLRVGLGPFGLADVMTALLTYILWQGQEWLVHAQLFHGNQGRAHFLFQSHDRHHDLPFFHVCAEPVAMCAIWFAAVSSLTAMAVFATGVPATLAVTSLATYTYAGVGYMSFHI